MKFTLLLLAALITVFPVEAHAQRPGETKQEQTDRLRQEQINRLMEWRRNFLRRQEAEQQRQQAERKAALERELAAIKALRQPPAKVWRVGRTLFWIPPLTADQLQPAGYWISEQRNGEWTTHGDYLPNTAREGELYGDGPAYVEAYYHDTALGEVYRSMVLSNPGDPPMIVSRVRFCASERRKGIRHVNRCRRVLAGFGVTEAKVGWAGHAAVSPLSPPMTADEAQRYAHSDSRFWSPIITVLRRIEGRNAPQTAPTERYTVDPSLIETVQAYLAERHGRPPIYYERWTRALAGLGHAKHDTPMTAAEAQGYADRGWRRWVPVADALTRLERERQ